MFLPVELHINEGERVVLDKSRAEAKSKAKGRESEVAAAGAAGASGGRYEVAWKKKGG